jgi:hypothetical protein
MTKYISLKCTTSIFTDFSTAATYSCYILKCNATGISPTGNCALKSVTKLKLLNDILSS